MELRHFLSAIALALPLASHAESEFSYDYLELSTAYISAEEKITGDDLNANQYSLKFSKELPFQLLAKADLIYQSADNKVDMGPEAVELTQDSYGYKLQFGRYFELHDQVNGLITVVHTRGHHDIEFKYTDSSEGIEFKNKNKDVTLSNGIDAGLRIHLDSKKRFELMPAILTRFDSDGADTGLELGFGFKPMTSLQLVAAYFTEPGDNTKQQEISLGARWYY